MAIGNLKQVVLGAITLVVVALLGLNLIGSLGQPQITDRLQLYQTDLILRATELDASDGQDWATAQKSLLGEQPLSAALEQYQDVRNSAATNLQKFQTQQSGDSTAQVQDNIQQQQELINQLDLHLGLLQAANAKPDEALKLWQGVIERAQSGITTPSSVVETAKVLQGLWSEPPRLLPDAESQIQRHLDGWFHVRALTRLYQLQQRQEAIATLQQSEQPIAQQTLLKLVLVSVLPTIAGIFGIGLTLVLLIRWGLQRQQGTLEPLSSWVVPWNWTVIVQALIVGFFFLGQIILPSVIGGLGLNFSEFGSRAKALYTLAGYILLAGSTLLVLYLSLRPYQPLPEGWFRLTGKRNWFVWGLGGYFVALPLMLIVSLLNQQIWQGQGGSNPLLQVVLDEGDGVALAIFFFTAAVAAPVFEELLFRGFLLPSLTRYVPTGGAIALSGLIFALAHLSLSEVLPLAVLGSILGYVYVRSRGLFAPMLLHSLWNSVTMIGLFILGSGVD